MIPRCHDATMPKISGTQFPQQQIPFLAVANCTQPNEYQTNSMVSLFQAVCEAVATSIPSAIQTETFRFPRPRQASLQAAFQAPSRPLPFH